MWALSCVGGFYGGVKNWDMGCIITRCRMALCSSPSMCPQPYVPRRAPMSHRYRSALALSVGLLILLASVARAADLTPARVAVYFSPTGGAIAAVVQEVRAATQQILIQAYS